MDLRTLSFPTDPPYGTTHSELGRTWEYVEPGIWKSKDGEDGWDSITDKPGQYPPEPHLHVIADVQGLQVELDSKALKTDLDTEIQARIDGDAGLQSQIDELEAYNDTQIKADLATETQARIDGDAALQDQIDNIDVVMDEPASDGKPYSRTVAGGQTVGTWTEAPAIEEIERIDGRIDAIEGNISGGGGFVEAPDDGEVYARDGQAPAWVKTYDADYIDAIDVGYKNADAALQSQIDGLEAYNDTQIKADLATETQARIDGDAALQDQINSIPDQDFSWDSVTGKPTEFPPEAHTQGWDTITDKPADYPPSVHGHEIAEVNGLQDALDAAGGTPAWDDVTGKPTEFPPEAHSQDWSTITNTPADFPPSAHGHAWDEVTGKPADYPPSVHGHEIADVDGLQDALDAAGSAPAWDDVTGKPTEFPPSAHNQDWNTITNPPTEYPPEAHTHEQGDIDGLEDRLDAIEGSITDGGGFVEAPNDGQLYGRQSETWAVIPDGGTGAGMVISDTPPTDKVRYAVA